MTQSWIVTLNPCIHHRLQTEYKEASASIISIEDFRQKYLSSQDPNPISSFELLNTKPEWVEMVGQYVECLKSKKIPPQDFRRAVEKNLFSLKKDFYVQVAEVYERVADLSLHKGLGGAEGEAPSPRPQVTRTDDGASPSATGPKDYVDTIMVLAHKLSDIQEDFLGTLAKVTEIKKIGSLSSNYPKGKFLVWEAPTQETEMNAIAKEIKELLKKKIVPLSSIYIFSCNLERQKTDFKIIFNREHIPCSFWNKVEGDVDRVSIFPLEPNTVVFGEMGAVFISGASYVAKDVFLMTEDERNYFNEKLGKNVFKTQAETKEETKELLSFLISHSKKLYVSYTHHLAISFKEFLEEYKKHSFKKLHVQSEMIPDLTLKSLKPFSPLILRQRKDAFLPKSYSIRALTQYERCPYGFLLKECLHLEPEKKITLELSYVEEGELIHTVLYRYFTKPEPLEKLWEEAYSVIADKFKKEILVPDRLRVEKVVSTFLQEEKKWQEKSRFTPHFFELPFDQLPLSWKGKTIILRGKIDRVDIDERAKEFKVIDYKTGSVVPKSVQLQLYAVAVETLFLPGYQPAEGAFYMLKNSEIKKGFECPTMAEWHVEKEKMLERIFGLVGKIEALSFPSTPHTCYDQCEIKNMCEHTENI